MLLSLWSLAAFVFSFLVIRGYSTNFYEGKRKVSEELININGANNNLGIITEIHSPGPFRQSGYVGLRFARASSNDEIQLLRTIDYLISLGGFDLCTEISSGIVGIKSGHIRRYCSPFSTINGLKSGFSMNAASGIWSLSSWLNPSSQLKKTLSKLQISMLLPRTPQLKRFVVIDEYFTTFCISHGVEIGHDCDTIATTVVNHLESQKVQDKIELVKTDNIVCVTNVGTINVSHCVDLIQHLRDIQLIALGKDNYKSIRIENNKFVKNENDIVLSRGKTLVDIFRYLLNNGSHSAESLLLSEVNFMRFICDWRIVCDTSSSNTCSSSPAEIGWFSKDTKMKDLTKSNASQVAVGDTICVSQLPTELDNFFNSILPQLRNPVILLSLGGDDFFPRLSHIWLLKSRNIVHWAGWQFKGQEFVPVSLRHKMSNLPIGINHYRNAKYLAETLIKHSRSENLSKKKKEGLLLANFGLYPTDHSEPYTSTNRQRLYDLAETWDFADVIYKLTDPKNESCTQHGHGLSRCGVETYYKTLSSYHFVLAPGSARFRDEDPYWLGRSASTHRAWESLYNGAIPVVRSSSLDNIFKNLPVLIVNDWSDITETLLYATLEEYGDWYEKNIENTNDKSESKQRSFNFENAFMPHWKSKIDTWKIEARSLELG